MFDSDERIKRIKNERDDLLLEAFILLEENNFNATKQAVNIYMRLHGDLPASKAFANLKQEYEQFKK